MSQPVPRYCPRCGTELMPQQKFCVNCGFSFVSNANAPSQAPLPPSDVAVKQGPISDSGIPPVQQGPISSGGQTPWQPGPISNSGIPPMQQGPVSNSGIPPMQQGPVSNSGIPPMQQGPISSGGQTPWQQGPVSNSGVPLMQQGPISNGGVPLMQQGPVSGAGQTSWQQETMYTRRPKKGKLLAVLVVLLVIVLLLVGAGYMAWPLLFPKPVKPVAVTVITKSINSTVNYAGANVTVQKAQQAASFSNDPGNGSSGVVRVYLQTVNNNSQSLVLDYATITTLVSAKGTTYKPIYVHDQANIAAGQTQAGYVDYSVPTSVSVSTLTLRLGTASEAQLSVPLSGHFNASEYASATMTENAQVYYFGLNWNVVSTSSQLNLNGQQADANDRFAVVTLQVSSSLSEDAVVGSAFDYLRLTIGSTTLSPVYTTLPVSFKTGVTNQEGTVAFMVPESAASGTLVFLGTNQNGFDQQTANLVLK